LKLLLDTHAALWFVGGDERMSEAAHRHLIDSSNVVLLSAVVVLEISIKRSLGKLRVSDEYLDLLLGAGVQPLPLSIAHAAAVEQLPWHHRDPFDRLIAATAQVEGLIVVSADSVFDAYGLTRLW